MHIYRNSLIVIGLLILISFSCKEEKKEAEIIPTRSIDVPIQAEGFIAKNRSLNENIQAPGTLLPFENTQIRSEISGRIVQLDIPEGKIVQKGTLLVKLFDSDLQAQLKKLEVQLSIAEKTLERQKALLAISGISQQEYDLSQLEANNLNADIELVKVNISKTRIVAPYTGKIGLKNISLGAYVTPLDVLTTISQVDNLKLEFTVPEKYSDAMIKGRKVDFNVSGSSKIYTATVMATESFVEANTRSLKVRAIVAERSSELIAGGFATVGLQFGKQEKIVVVPTQSIIPQAREKKVILFQEGKPEFVTVTTGIRDSSYVQILDGIKEGDTVITTALLAIRPESKIALTKVN